MWDVEIRATSRAKCKLGHVGPPVNITIKGHDDGSTEIRINRTYCLKCIVNFLDENIGMADEVYYPSEEPFVLEP